MVNLAQWEPGDHCLAAEPEFVDLGKEVDDEHSTSSFSGPSGPGIPSLRPGLAALNFSAWVPSAMATSTPSPSSGFGGTSLEINPVDSSQTFGEMVSECDEVTK